MKVIIGMATMRGREGNVTQAVKSLKQNQVKPDQIIVYDNTVSPDLADNGKFFGLVGLTEPVYYLTCDDDLIYPKDYIKVCLREIEKHKAIITFHGRQLGGLGRNYYHGHTNFPCLRNMPLTLEIDVCGTGVTAFRTDYFNPVGLHLAEDRLMSDLVFSVEAAHQDKRIVHIGHRAGWIKQQNIPIERTIYGMEHRKCERQNQFADEIWTIKFGPAQVVA